MKTNSWKPSNHLRQAYMLSVSKELKRLGGDSEKIDWNSAGYMWLENYAVTKAAQALKEIQNK